MAVSVQIKGLSTASKRLQSIPRKCLKEVANGVNQAAAVVNAGAKRNCPVDTGILRSTIHAEPAKADGDSVVATVGTSLEYAPYVEFGTGSRGGYPYETDIPLSYKKDWPGQAAQPFLGKSLHENKPTVHKIIQDATNRGLSNV